MRHLTRVAAALSLAGCLGAAALPAAADSAPSTCTAGLTIFSTSTGATTQAGPITIFRASGVAGQYTSGVLAGDRFSGAQDIVMNNQTKQSDLRGSYLVTAPDGSTLTVSYTGHADLTTGKATGSFVTSGGTGQLAGFKWVGSIAAQLTSLTPPTFQATDTGLCRTAP